MVGEQVAEVLLRVGDRGGVVALGGVEGGGSGGAVGSGAAVVDLVPVAGGGAPVVEAADGLGDGEPVEGLGEVVAPGEWSEVVEAGLAWWSAGVHRLVGAG